MAKVPPILYCGDHALNDAARYLAGAMRAAGFAFDYVPSDARWPRAAAANPYRLYILSDYPSRYLGAANARRIAERVRGGAGLLMIGGWGSFTGLDGLYGRTALADVLPVRCLPRDDRRQGAAAYRIAPGRNGDGLAGFRPADFSKAPTLAGYNKTLLKSGAESVLTVETVGFEKNAGSAPGAARKVRVTAVDPLLAAWSVGSGRAAAYCSDLAPHWSGGLVDWGPRRVVLKAAPGITAEAGSTFARFAAALVRLALKK